MSKVQEYLRKRRISELPKIWIVISDRNGVEKPVEYQVTEIIEGVSIQLPIGSRVDRYKLDSSPFNVDILDGETSGKDEGYGSGIGDLWGWTNYGTLSKEEAYNYYLTELTRVTDRYLTL